MFFGCGLAWVKEGCVGEGGCGIICGVYTAKGICGCFSSCAPYDGVEVKLRSFFLLELEGG